MNIWDKDRTEDQEALGNSVELGTTSEDEQLYRGRLWKSLKLDNGDSIRLNSSF